MGHTFAFMCSKIGTKHFANRVSLCAQKYNYISMVSYGSDAKDTHLRLPVLNVLNQNPINNETPYFH